MFNTNIIRWWMVEKTQCPDAELSRRNFDDQRQVCHKAHTIYVLMSFRIIEELHGDVLSDISSLYKASEAVSRLTCSLLHLNAI
jgi:hypothetical protein